MKLKELMTTKFTGTTDAGVEYYFYMCETKEIKDGKITIWGRVMTQQGPTAKTIFVEVTDETSAEDCSDEYDVIADRVRKHAPISLKDVDLTLEY